MGESGEALGATLITVVAIFLAAILMYVVPFDAISDMNDQETLAKVQAYVDEHVNNITSEKEITLDEYNGLVQKLNATGNTYEIEYEVHISDTNPGKKTENQQVGDTEEYIVYTKQIEEVLNTVKKYPLKQGDYVVVRVKNTNTTISQMFKTLLYKISGDLSYVISAEASAPVV